MSAVSGGLPQGVNNNPIEQNQEDQTQNEEQQNTTTNWTTAGAAKADKQEKQRRKAEADRKEKDRRNHEMQIWEQIRQNRPNKRYTAHEQEAQRMGLGPREYITKGELIEARQQLLRVTRCQKNGCPVTARHLEGECREGRCVYCGEKGHKESDCPYKQRTGLRAPMVQTQQVRNEGRVVIRQQVYADIAKGNNGDAKHKELLRLFASEIEGLHECTILFRTMEEQWKIRRETVKEILKHQGMEETVPKAIQATADNKKVTIAFATKLEQERFETDRNFHVDDGRAEVVYIRAKGKTSTRITIRGFPLKKPITALKALLGYFGEVEGDILENKTIWEETDDVRTRDGIYTVEMKLKHHIPRRLQVGGETMVTFYTNQKDCECKLPTAECKYPDEQHTERHERLKMGSLAERTREIFKMRGIGAEIMGVMGDMEEKAEEEELKELLDKDIAVAENKE